MTSEALPPDADHMVSIEICCQVSVSLSYTKLSTFPEVFEDQQYIFAVVRYLP